MPAPYINLSTNLSLFLCLLSDDYKLDHQRMDNVINEFTENAPIKGIRIKYGIYKNIDKNLPITTIFKFFVIYRSHVTK